MPFNDLLQRLCSCSIDRTSHTESGCHVYVRPEPGETVCFYVVDDQKNRNCTLRRDFGIVGSICDLMVFYARASDKVFCLVELKGSDQGHAVEQVTNTCQHLRPRFSGYSPTPIGWKAYIYVHSAAPIKTEPRWRSQLEGTFGRGNFAVKHDKDLGKFLRA
jgi:hypothetical protein